MSGHFYIYLSIFLGVISQLIIKWKMSNFSLDNYETYYDKFLFAMSMLVNPYIVISLILTLFAGLAWMLAMTKFDISYAYPFTMLGFVLILVLSSIFFNEVITWHKMIGLLLITVGVIISSRSL